MLADGDHIDTRLIRQDRFVHGCADRAGIGQEAALVVARHIAEGVQAELDVLDVDHAILTSVEIRWGFRRGRLCRLS